MPATATAAPTFLTTSDPTRTSHKSRYVKALTTDLFRRQARDPTLSRAEALRSTMMGLIDGPGFVDDQGRSVFSYAHPLFWAPFSLVGDGGGNSAGT